MSFDVQWHKRALKALSKLPKYLIVKINSKIISIKKDPFRHVEHFEGKDLFKLRFGDYRAVIKVDSSSKTIKILAFNHRKKVYKK